MADANSTSNLFTAAELVYSEFDALRASRREHNTLFD